MSFQLGIELLVQQIQMAELHESGAIDENSFDSDKFFFSE
jgi:hypothetical protein